MGKLTQEPDHEAGECWCGLVHTVPGAARLNGIGNYSDMIRRTAGESDPLVKEPKDGNRNRN
jgi:hypothetical protein